MGTRPDREAQPSPIEFFRQHAVALASETVANTIGLAAYTVVTGESHRSLVMASIQIGFMYFTAERRNPLVLGVTKATLAAFNAFALLEMVATFESAPLFTGEFTVLAAANYFILSRFAPSAGNRTSA